MVALCPNGYDERTKNYTMTLAAARHSHLKGSCGLEIPAHGDKSGNQEEGGD
jgi:hypothetical protein